MADNVHRTFVDSHHATSANRSRARIAPQRVLDPVQASPLQRLQHQPGGWSAMPTALAASARPDMVAQLQRTHGNGHVQQVIAQTRTSRPALTVQRCGGKACNCSPAERMTHAATEMPAALDRAAASVDIAGMIEQSSGGQALSTVARQKLEPAMGFDLGHVSIHHDTKSDMLARAVDAEAFTTGDHIFFREGRYDPHSTSGLRLLAHEVTHTKQQAAGSVSGLQHFGGIQVSEPGDPFEHEAEQAADAAVALISGPAPAKAGEKTSPQPLSRLQRRAQSSGVFVQRSFQQDTSPGLNAKWTPFASVNGPPFFQQTNFDTDGFHEEFNIPPKSSGRVIMLADVEWSGGGTGPNPLPKPDQVSDACKTLMKLTSFIPA